MVSFISHKKFLLLNKNHAQKHNLKYSFTILELSIVIVIITVMLSVIIISKSLITTAKIGKVQKDFLDFNALSSIFYNTYDCLPGDCDIKQLPQSIIDSTPSSCFNLNTTTGLGNSLSLGNGNNATALASSAVFNTNQIDSNLKRTCTFYEMKAMEPQVFRSSSKNNIKNSAYAFNSVLGVNNANAMGVITFNSIDGSGMQAYKAQISNICLPFGNAVSRSTSALTASNYGSFMNTYSVSIPTSTSQTDCYTFITNSPTGTYSIETSMDGSSFNFNINNGTNIGATNSANIFSTSTITSIPTIGMKNGINTICVTVQGDGGGD